MAKAAQAMTEGAKNGSISVMDEQYVEREPNPNAYVGELIFKRYCDSCHGQHKGPDLIHQRVTTPDPESDYYIIRYGMLDMPGFRNRLTQFQILDILAYMKTDFTGTKLLKVTPDSMSGMKKTMTRTAEKSDSGNVQNGETPVSDEALSENGEQEK